MKVLTHHRDGEKYIRNISDWMIDEKEKEKVREFIKEYVSGRITGKKGSNPDALIEKITQSLKVCLEKISIPIINKKNVEKFFDDLVVHKKIKSKFSKKPYPIKSQITMLGYLRSYLKWRYNDNDLISPLNVKIATKERDIESLTLQEVEQLYKNCKSNEERYIISMLFSSGMRAEEFVNIKRSDIILPEKNEFIRVMIRNETSKTKGRTISLYWVKSLEGVSEYILEREKEGMKPDDFVLTRSYDSLRVWVRRLGQRVLNKNVHFHQFRHASCDWMASKINRNQMCVFYGWKFSSPMPDVYISRQNIDMKDADTKIQSNSLQEIKDEFEKKDFENKMKIEELTKKISSLVSISRVQNSALNKINKKKLSVNVPEDIWETFDDIPTK